MAFHLFCETAIAGNTIEVFGDGTQTRDFTFVSDVVAAIRAAGAAPDIAGEVFNVGGGSQIAVNDALAVISGLMGREFDVRYVEPRFGDVTDTGAGTTRAQAKLDSIPMLSFEDGQRAQCQWVMDAERK